MDIGALVRAFFDLAGPGGILAFMILVTALIVYFLVTRWILGKPENDK
jgi:putative effector of murein hydrolase LrgA (UPF0299 family)